MKGSGRDAKCAGTTARGPERRRRRATDDLTKFFVSRRRRRAEIARRGFPRVFARAPRGKAHPSTSRTSPRAGEVAEPVDASVDGAARRDAARHSRVARRGEPRVAVRRASGARPLEVRGASAKPEREPAALRERGRHLRARCATRGRRATRDPRRLHPRPRLLARAPDTRRDAPFSRRSGASADHLRVTLARRIRDVANERSGPPRRTRPYDERPAAPLGPVPSRRSSNRTASDAPDRRDARREIGEADGRAPGRR